MKLTKKEFVKMVDMTELRVAATADDIRLLVKDAAENGFQHIACMKSYHPILFEELRKYDMIGKIDVLAGAGFPTGGDKTIVKIVAIRDCIADGCTEVDVTGNTGFIKSGMWKEYKEELRLCVKAAEGRTTKLILSVPLLTEDEIRKAVDIAAEVGFDWVKTDTGWSPRHTTLEDVEMLVKIVDGRLNVKASGGVRSLEIVQAYYNAGARRFGMSRQSAMKVLNELED